MSFVILASLARSEAADPKAEDRVRESLSEKMLQAELGLKLANDAQKAAREALRELTRKSPWFALPKLLFIRSEHRAVIRRNVRVIRRALRDNYLRPIKITGIEMNPTKIRARLGEFDGIEAALPSVLHAWEQRDIRFGLNDAEFREVFRYTKAAIWKEYWKIKLRYMNKVFQPVQKLSPGSCPIDLTGMTGHP